MSEPFLPAAERVEIIRKYQQEYRTKWFLETGTAFGDTTAALLDEFETLITIELDPALHAQAVERFKPYRHVACMQGDSGQLLRRMLINETTLFWLDGHYCGGARGSIDTPIREELEGAVLAPHGSVILIDDARLFGGMSHHTEEFADYPDLEWVAEYCVDHGYIVQVADDIIRCVPS